MSVGDYIKGLRNKSGYSQEQLGNLLGVQRAAVQKWECGKVKNFKRETIKKLSEIFNVSPSSFFEDNCFTVPDNTIQNIEINVFGNILQDLRKRNGLTQTELGNVLGLAYSTISMYERGERLPDYNRIEDIADFFHVSIDFLHGRSDN